MILSSFPCAPSLERAAHILKDNEFGHLAVVDGDGILIGYLSQRDLEKAAAWCGMAA